MLPELARVLFGVTFSPPAKVEVMAFPSALLGPAKLPMSAFETRSPASTWNPVVLDEKESCCFPLVSVFIAAVMLAFWSAVPAGVPLLPAFCRPLLMAVISVPVSVTF